MFMRTVDQMLGSPAPSEGAGHYSNNMSRRQIAPATPEGALRRAGMGNPTESGTSDVVFALHAAEVGEDATIDVDDLAVDEFAGFRRQ